MQQISTAPVFLVVLALASCTSSTATVAEDPPANGAAATRTEDPKVNPNAKLLQDFKERVEKYVSIHKSAGDHTPPLKKTEDPAEIKAAQDALAQRIRGLLANAKPGDIFTPEITAHFRRLLRPEVKERGTKESILDDNPGNIPHLKVNSVYPENEPLSMVPPNVLMTLPMLPEDIEYRFVGKHLILHDARANLIIDYIPNAIP